MKIGKDTRVVMVVCFALLLLALGISNVNIGTADGVKAQTKSQKDQHGVLLNTGPRVRVIEGIVLESVPSILRWGVGTAPIRSIRVRLGFGLSDIYLGRPPKEWAFPAKEEVINSLRVGQKVWLKVLAEPRVHCGGNIADHGLTLLEIKPQKPRRTNFTHLGTFLSYMLYLSVV